MRTISVSLKIDGLVNLTRVVRYYNGNYEPELFPAAMFTFKIVYFTYFHTCTVLMAGIKRRQQLYDFKRITFIVKCDRRDCPNPRCTVLSGVNKITLSDIVFIITQHHIYIFFNLLSTKHHAETKSKILFSLRSTVSYSELSTIILKL